MANFSAAHAPRSIWRQRSEQKGRQALSGLHGAGLAQVGHLTFLTMATL